MTEKQIAQLLGKAADEIGDEYADLMEEAERMIRESDDDTSIAVVIAWFLSSFESLLRRGVADGINLGLTLLSTTYGVALTSGNQGAAEISAVMDLVKAEITASRNAIGVSAAQTGLREIDLAKTQLFTPRRKYHMRQALDIAVARAPQAAIFEAGKAGQVFPFKKAVAVLDSHTTALCRGMNGQVVPWDKPFIGPNGSQWQYPPFIGQQAVPGMHFCRTVMVPVKEMPRNET